MDLTEFQVELISKLSALEFVESWEISKKRTTIKIKVFLQKKSFLNIFYNMVLRIQSFALIINQERVWGLDRDNRFDWHEHPVSKPESHKPIEAHSIEQIVMKLEKVWYQIQKE